ncbi:MAG: hypothetical protein LBJ23_01200, partial [Tannerella sp.]|nr:hypothetical protein [Tannerella sp.]
KNKPEYDTFFLRHSSGVNSWRLASPKGEDRALRDEQRSWTNWNPGGKSADYFRVQVFPFRIIFLYQVLFPIPVPSFQVLFSNVRAKV